MDTRRSGVIAIRFVETFHSDSNHAATLTHDRAAGMATFCERSFVNNCLFLDGTARSNFPLITRDLIHVHVRLTGFASE